MANARPRYWFPLALLGFAQLLLVAAALLSASSRFGVSMSSRRNPVSGGLFGIGAETSTGWFAYVDSPPSYAFASVGAGWLWVLVAAVLGVAAWYFVLARRAGSPPRTGRFVLLTLGALVAVPLLDLVGFWQFRLDADVRGPMIATLGLVLLAWFERSVLVLVVTAVFVLAAVVFLPGIAGALVSAVALLAGAFAALAGPRRGRPEPAADTD
ncbi:hypothetical protein [Amycolatopsis sp. NPDC059021]|uniref:hypothetical protein n=1 Tax=Amycolatopsis sp. NPDC059021 TaxID=3346704 RepID=UPI00366A9330